MTCSTCGRGHASRSDVPADMAAPYQQGRLSKTCPVCGLTEAASFRCSACLAHIDPAIWAAQTPSETQLAARAHWVEANQWSPRESPR